MEANIAAHKLDDKYTGYAFSEENYPNPELFEKTRQATFKKLSREQ